MDPRSHTISMTARQTGLPVDTIRAWERRYGLVAPVRDAAGIRRYAPQDVRRLELARRATELGYRIGDVATLPDAQLARLVRAPGRSQRRPARAGDPSRAAVAAILGAIERFDRVEAQASLARAALLMPARELVLGVLAPLLHDAGDRWEAGRLTIAQEHLISQLVRDVLGSLSQTRSFPGTPALLFATPPGEQHEFGIALAAALAAAHGVSPCVLGADLPLQDLLRATRAMRPRAVVVGATAAPAQPQTQRYVADLDRRLPASVDLILGGSGARSIATDRLSRRASAIESLDEFAERIVRYAGPRG